MATNDDEEPSYIDYETFLSPDFSAAAFANSLVLATNNPNDSPLDLSTPLSRVLFDTQEIDSHIDILTTRSAIPLLEYTRDQTASSKRIISELEGQIKALNDGYKQLEKEVVDKHAEAEEVKIVATRLWETLKLGRSVGRCLQLGRQLEVQHAEISGSGTATSSTPAVRKEDHRALVRCSHTILSLREILEKTDPGQEGFGISRVDAIRSLQEGIIGPIEALVRDSARRIVRDFSLPSTVTFSQAEETKAKTVSALVTLYLVSPTIGVKPDKWTPRMLLDSLEEYLRTALQTSILSLARALGQLPTLDRTLSEVSTRCQNIVALEAILDSTKAPAHLLLPVPAASQKQGNLLQPLLGYLETGSLASYFWRTMASSLATRVMEIINRGGVAARTLKTNRASVGDAIRECVIKGSQPPSSVLGMKGSSVTTGVGNWDREAAVMVGSVVNNVGR
jgi:Golgi transport complex subunit 5